MLNESMRKWVYPALSFLIPFFLLLFAVFLLEIDPFGPHSFAISDGKQYIKDLVYMGRTLRGKESLLYSFYGGGQNRWVSYATGDLHPLMLITSILNIDTVYYYYTWITILSISLCGLTMYILLTGMKGHRFSNLIFSTSYALMGFCAVYFIHYHFLIGPQMLPLVMLGEIRLLKEKKPWLYIAALFIVVLLNFYFGFMLCIASLLAMLGLFFAEKIHYKWNTLALYFSSSAIAGLLGAFVWLPAIKALAGGGRLSQIGQESFAVMQDFPFWQMFTKLFTGANSVDEMVSGLPFIFCGILVVALSVAYFMFGKAERRKKIAAGSMLFFYLVAFCSPVLNALMHGGATPNGFNFRYSFVFSFFLICLAAEQFEQKITAKQAGTVFLILLAIAAAVFTQNYEYISITNVLIDFALLGLMGALYCAHQNGIVRWCIFIPLLFLIVCINLFGNFYLSVTKMRDYEVNTGEALHNNIVIGGMAEAIQSADRGLYRMEKDYDRSGIGETGTDDVYYGYYGLNRWGPATRLNIHKGYARLGFGWMYNLTQYTSTVPSPTDTLLGLKYLISKRDLTEEKGYERLVTVEDRAIYRNQEAMSFATLVNARTQRLSLGDSVPENLNAIFQTMTGEDRNVFVVQDDVTFSFPQNPYHPTTDEVKGVEDNDDIVYVEYTFTPKNNGVYYMFLGAIPASEYGLPVEASDCIGTLKAGETVVKQIAFSTLEYSMKQIKDYCSWLVVAGVNNELVQEYAALLNHREISFNIEKESLLRGSFSAEEGQCILFTLPWDEGWSCYIDGQKIPIHKTWDLFMTVDAPVGKHTYEMRFYPAWMDYGIALSGCAVIGMIVLAVLLRRRRERP